MKKLFIKNNLIKLIIKESILNLYFKKLNKLSFLNYSNLYSINEKYGLIDYNEESDNIINNVSNEITYFLKSINSKKYNSKIIDNSNNILPFNFKIFFINPNIKWVNKINIYVTKELLNGNADTVLLDEYYSTFYNNRKEIALIYNSDKTVNTMSILIFGEDKKYSVKSRILHEMKHLYDSYVQNKPMNIINKDLLILNNVTFDENDEKLILKIISSNNIPSLKNIIKELTSIDLINIVLYNIYIMNKSEMQARLEQIREDINKILIHSKFSNKKDLLSSSIYKEYLSFYVLYKLIIKYIPNNIKQEFIESDYFYQIANRAYKSKQYVTFYDFNSGTSQDYKKTFDNLFKYFYIEIYNKVLKHSASLYIDKTLKEDKLIRKS